LIDDIGNLTLAERSCFALLGIFAFAELELAHGYRPVLSVAIGRFVGSESLAQN
jgi:hypothetical protein